MKGLESVIDFFLASGEYRNRVTFVKRIKAKEAVFADFPHAIDPDLRSALEKKGIKKLYSHQAETFRLVEEGKNTVIVTPTASGKTLCYNLPVLNALIRDNNTKAMYIFPTKALAQDQADEVNELGSLLKEKINIFVYDGDTPASIRQSIRTKGQIIITNPDMLHSGILPNHPKWVKIFEKLKYIVIDEVHTYRGVFGSHLANLILRLKRIARFYNSEVQFILCSATIRNPGELSAKLIDADVTVVEKNGAPQGEKYFLLYNPPLVNAEQGIRRSVILEAQRLASDLISSGISTIVFARSRLNTELIYSYLIREKRLEPLKERIKSYRGGYLPSERRKIEQELRNGTVTGVVSTNALELGIDIGQLDACVLAGYPGSIASVWQQAGRSGRKSNLSAAILVASNHPLDQFLIKNSEYFFSRSPEEAIINPENLFILMDHIKCAAFELPFREKERFGPSAISDMLDYLEQERVVHKSGDTWYWNADSYPAESVSLRSAMTDNVVIVNTTDNRDTVIGEVDRASAPYLLFEEAIYIHLGNQYKVEKLDLESGKAYVKEVSVNYYTDAIAKSDIEVLKVDKTGDMGRARKHYLSVSIKTVVPKFKKIKFINHENIGYGDIHLPQTEMQTYAIALEFREEMMGNVCGTERLSEILMGIANLLRNIAPLYIICDFSDIRTSEQRKSDFFNNPALFVYDAYPGGVGLSEKLYGSLDLLLREILKAVSQCECRYGCPSCIGPADEFAKETKGNVIKALQSLKEAC